MNMKISYKSMYERDIKEKKLKKEKKQFVLLYSVDKGIY